MQTKKELKHKLTTGQITKAQYDQALSSRQSQTKKTSKTPRSKVNITLTKQAAAAVVDRARMANQHPKMQYTPSVINNAGTQLARRVEVSAKRTVSRNIFNDYVRTLLDPHTYQSRFPDSMSRPTTIWHTTAVIDVPFNINNNGVQQFSLCVSPIPGDISAPPTYQVALVDNTNPANWLPTTDWSAASTYVSNVGGRDPRVDVNAPYLLSPPVDSVSYTNVYSNFANGAYSIFNTIPNAASTAVRNAVSYRAQPIPLATTNNVTAGTFQALRVPVGSWILTFNVNVNPNTTAGLIQMVVDPANTTAAVSLLSNTATPITSGTATGFGSVFAVTSTTGAQQIAFIIESGGGAPIANPSALTVNWTMVPAAFGNKPFPATTGIVEQIRPVAMSVLATCTAPALINGGNIAAAMSQTTMPRQTSLPTLPVPPATPSGSPRWPTSPQPILRSSRMAPTFGGRLWTWAASHSNPSLWTTQRLGQRLSFPALSNQARL
jgi:hypothetical protein